MLVNFLTLQSIKLNFKYLQDDLEVIFFTHLNLFKK